MPRDLPLHAITIWQPWTHAILQGWKPVENRTWPPPPQLIGRPIALHAGKRLDGDAFQTFLEYREQLGIPAGGLDATMHTSAIVGVATLAGAIQVVDANRRGEVTVLALGVDSSRRLRATKILGAYAITAQQALDVTRSPWSSGPWCWVLRDVVAIEPVPCPGAQKVWRVPPMVAAEVGARLAQRRGERAEHHHG